MSRILYLIAAALLFISAVAVSPKRQRLPAFGRDLIRPVVLPAVWNSLESARLSGTPEEFADKGRLLVAMLPRWTDGHIHVASQLAFEASLAQEDREQALDRIFAAQRLLEHAKEVDPRPAAVREYQLHQCRFLLLRCWADPLLAAAYLRRAGESYATGALRFLPDGANRDRWVILLSGLPEEVRMQGDPARLHARLLQQVEAVIDHLRYEANAELRQECGQSMDRLRSFLRHPDDIKNALAALGERPHLRDTSAAILARADYLEFLEDLRRARAKSK